MGYRGRMRGSEKIYESVIVELLSFQRGVAQQVGILKSLIRCYLGEDNEFFLFLSTSFYCSSSLSLFPLSVHTFSLFFSAFRYTSALSSSLSFDTCADTTNFF